MSHITLEMRAPAEGVFVLDRSTLGGSEPLALNESTGNAWRAIECDATAIQATRGGSRDGVSAAIEVGALTASFLDGANPLDDPDVRPGVPIRLIETTTSDSLFTGRIDDLQVNYSKSDDHSRVTMRAVDAVAQIAGTMRYGAEGPEPWQARFSRLLASSPVPFVAPEPDPTLIVIDSLTGSDMFGDWSGSWSDAGGHIFTNSTNVTSSYILSGLTPGMVYELEMEFRAEPFMGTASLQIDTPVEAAQDIPGSGKITVATRTFFARSTTHTITIESTPGDIMAIESLTLGAVPVTLWASPIIHASDLASHLDIAANSAAVGWYVDHDGTIRVQDFEDAETVAKFSDVHDDDDPMHVCYTGVGISFDTSEIANTITLSNHGRRMAGETLEDYTPPADSVQDTTSGATIRFWNPVPTGRLWVSVEIKPTVTVRGQLTTDTAYAPVILPAGVWTRLEGPVDGGDGLQPGYVLLSPPGVSYSWQTRNARVRVAEDFEADDYGIGPFTDFASVATWGERLTEVETAIWDGPTYLHRDHPRLLAERLLARVAHPEPLVSSVTFNALEYPEIAASLDVWSLVEVTHRDITQELAVVGIEHDIDPDEWFITIQLMKAG